MRKGTLTDKATLKAYEGGASILALCMHEGMTAHGMIGRIARARKQRRERHPAYWARRKPTKKPSELIASLDGLRDAVARLERA